MNDQKNSEKIVDVNYIEGFELRLWIGHTSWRFCSRPPVNPSTWSRARNERPVHSWVIHFVESLSLEAFATGNTESPLVTAGNAKVATSFPVAAFQLRSINSSLKILRDKISRCLITQPSRCGNWVKMLMPLAFGVSARTLRCTQVQLEKLHANWNINLTTFVICYLLWSMFKYPKCKESESEM